MPETNTTQNSSVEAKTDTATNVNEQFVDNPTPYHTFSPGRDGKCTGCIFHKEHWIHNAPIRPKALWVAPFGSDSGAAGPRSFRRRYAGIPARATVLQILHAGKGARVVKLVNERNEPQWFNLVIQ